MTDEDSDTIDEQLENHIDTVEPDEQLREYHEDESVTVLYGHDFWEAIEDGEMIDSGRVER